MRDIPSSLSAHIAGGCTTLCHCLKLVRLDGVVMGFTDHDRDLQFDGVTYLASSGLSTSDVEEQLGMGPAKSDIVGALSSECITEDDLVVGKYDGAYIEVWLVNWEQVDDVDARLLLYSGELGRINRGVLHFEAELRTLMTKLQQVRGRVFAYGCSASVGDARCGIDIQLSTWYRIGVITFVHGATIHVSGLSDAADNFFTHGVLEITSGPFTGTRVGIVVHKILDGDAVLTLATTLPQAVSVGDTVKVTVGCDKSFSMCRDKFNNGANFRGFPHMPGNDYVISYPVHGDPDLDGGSIN